MHPKSPIAIMAVVSFAVLQVFAADVPRTPIHRRAGKSHPARIGVNGISAPVGVTAFGGFETYHNGDTLMCTDCHSIHASAQHALDGDTAGFPYTEPAHTKLLKKADPVDVCLSCHDSMAGVPDVITTDVNGLTERSAGFLDQPDTPSFRGHNLGRGLSLDTLCERCHFGGSMATATVSCIDCHNPHGNDKARNLQWASSPGGEPVFALFTRPGVTGLQKYERANTAHSYVPLAATEITNMCIDCHHAFFDDSSHTYTKPGGMTHFGRHANFNSEWGALDTISVGGVTGSTDPAHWDAGTGSGFDGAARVPFVATGATTFMQAAAVNATANAVFCLSCHKAHGGDQPFGLMWVPGTTPRPKGCDQCHGVAK